MWRYSDKGTSSGDGVGGDGVLVEVVVGLVILVIGVVKTFALGLYSHGLCS